MRENWEKCHLEDYIKLIDYRGRTPVKTESGVRLITAKNVKLGYLQLEPQEFIHPDEYESWMTRGIPNFGDVIFTTEAPLANVAQLDTNEKVAFAQRIIVMQPQKNKIDQTFLKYLLLSDSVRNEILEKGTGATVQGIKSSLLKKVQLYLPPLPEQHHIVAILDEAFAAIAKAKANAEQNLKNTKELFESYLQGVFEQRGEDWEEKQLGEVCSLITKGSSPKWQGIEYVDAPGILFVTSENVGEGELILEHRKYVEEKFNLKDKKSILQKGDVLTNIVGASIGRTAIYTIDDVANINQAVCILRCKPELISNQYLMNLLNSPFLKEILHDNEVNTARANLSLGFFTNLSIPLPPLAAQQSIVEKLNSLSAQTKKLEAIYQQKLNDLEELKKVILQKAFSGELKTLNAVAV
jgi:type I restriction enzyme S subunit